MGNFGIYRMQGGIGYRVKFPILASAVPLLLVLGLLKAVLKLAGEEAGGVLRVACAAGQEHF